MARRKTAGKPEMVTTDAELKAVRLELPADIHKALRVAAAQEDVSMAVLARQLVIDGLSKRGAK